MLEQALRNPIVADSLLILIFMATILGILVLSTYFVTYLRETDPAVVEVHASAEYRDCVSHLSEFTTSLLSPEEHLEPYCLDYHYGHRPDLATAALLAAIYRSDLRHHRSGLTGPGRPPGGQQGRHGLGRLQLLRGPPDRPYHLPGIPGKDNHLLLQVPFRLDSQPGNRSRPGGRLQRPIERRRIPAAVSQPAPPPGALGGATRPRFHKRTQQQQSRLQEN